MILGWARIRSRYGRAVIALIRPIMVAVVGLIASTGLNASSARAKTVGKDRLIHTEARAAARPLFSSPKLTGATVSERNDITMRPPGLITLMTLPLVALTFCWAHWQSCATTPVWTRTSTFGPWLRLS
ncbi:MAG: hypothetical protein ACXU95_14505 [Isosphaeraceae bacterium]